MADLFGLRDRAQWQTCGDRGAGGVCDGLLALVAVVAGVVQVGAEALVGGVREGFELGCEHGLDRLRGGHAGGSFGLCGLMPVKRFTGTFHDAKP